jgi:hypothetical protein
MSSKQLAILKVGLGFRVALALICRAFRPVRSEWAIAFVVNKHRLSPD